MAIMTTHECLVQVNKSTYLMCRYFEETLDVNVLLWRICPFIEWRGKIEAVRQGQRQSYIKDMSSSRDAVVIK